MNFKKNLNLFGLIFLLVAFLVSVARVVMLSAESGEGPLSGGKKVIRLLHWQLEPGYREAMQDAIDSYNKLPHVVEANVEVRQMAVTERVYEQFLNVHLISGTAPDIVEKGKARMAGGHFTARYFEPLADHVKDPNPYNAREYLPERVPEELVKLLATIPWRESFIDGMRGGWDDTLQNYFAVPSAFWGPVRLYYNEKMMMKAKGLVRRSMDAQPQPDWLANALRPLEDGGYLPDTPELRAWLDNPKEPPQTLGQLLLVCFSVPELRSEVGDSRLVPISGSSYGGGMFAGNYLVPFTARLAIDADYDLDSDTSAVEMRAAWRKKEWDFNDPHMRGYFEAIQLISAQFPPGFLGLDREQSNRRFTQGHAMMIATGGWDAISIFQGAENKTNPEDRFHVGVTDFPMPGPGERWHHLIEARASEAGISAGAPYAIYQQSRNKEWALDFMRYLTSFKVNEEFNRQAGWIPCIVGTSPSERMKPFTPITRGIKNQSISLGRGSDHVSSEFNGQFLLYQTGDIPYEQMVEVSEAAMREDRMGLNRFWFMEWQKERDNYRNLERMLAVQTCRQLMTGAEDAVDKYRAGLSKSAVDNGGEHLRSLWYQVNPDDDFPNF